LNGNDPVRAISDAARTLFELDGNSVTLSPGVLQPDDTGISNAIILVCQQVLAVEDMVRQGEVYSENAYFPRLRMHMAPQLPAISSNPFRFDEFESIWRQLAREIRAIPGATEDSITFQFGSYSGVNKARLFPLSQALFSRSDLQLILSYCRNSWLLSDSVKDIWTEIWRERSRLSRRGQHLVNSGFLRERIVEQVRRFVGHASNPAANSAARSQQRIHALRFGIGINMVDWCTEQFFGFLVSKSDAPELSEDGHVANKVRAITSERGYAFLTLSSSREYWHYVDGVVDNSRGDTLLLLGTQPGILRGRAVLDGLSPSVDVPETRIQPLGSGQGIYVCRVDFPEDYPTTVAVRAGRIVAGSQEASRSQFQWVGGVCIDTRQRLFLRDALPTGIRFGDAYQGLDTVSRVGSSAMSWSSLCKQIAKLEANAIFDIGFQDGRRATLAVGIANDAASERVGYRIQKDGRLSPTLESLGDADRAVIGFNEPEPICIPPSPAEVALLLKKFRAGKFTSADSGDLHESLTRIISSNVPKSVKDTLAKLIASLPPFDSKHA
jgi:hypothetical protein